MARDRNNTTGKTWRRDKTERRPRIYANRHKTAHGIRLALASGEFDLQLGNKID